MGIRVSAVILELLTKRGGDRWCQVLNSNVQIEVPLLCPDDHSRSRSVDHRFWSNSKPNNRKKMQV